MEKVKYSGVRESKPGRINDLGTTGKEKMQKNTMQGICMDRSEQYEKRRGLGFINGI